MVATADFASTTVLVLIAVDGVCSIGLLLVCRPPLPLLGAAVRVIEQSTVAGFARLIDVLSVVFDWLVCMKPDACGGCLAIVVAACLLVVLFVAFVDATSCGCVVEGCD